MNHQPEDLWRVRYARGEDQEIIKLAGERLADKETLSAAEHATVSGWRGLALLRSGDPGGATADLQRALARDPRWLDVALALGTSMLQAGRTTEAQDAFASMFIFGGHHLDERHARGLRALGDAYRESEALDRARAVLDLAATLAPDDLDVATSQLQVLAALGLEEASIMLRTKLLTRPIPVGRRVRLQREQGVALLRIGDEAGGIFWLAEAYRGQQDDETFTALVDALTAAERYEELAALLESRLTEADPARLARSGDALARVYEEHLNDPMRAALVLDRLLDAFPAELQRFERLNVLVASVKAWRELHDAYARMIRRAVEHHADNAPLLALLWRNLGELCRTQLSDPSAALYAFQMSYRHQSDPAVDEHIVALSSQIGDPERQLEPLLEALTRHPGRLDLAERLGIGLLKDNQSDRGYLVLRLATSRGAGSEEAHALVKRLAPKRKLIFDRPLSRSLLQKYVEPSPRMRTLNTLFEIAYHTILPEIALTLDDHDTRSRNRVPLDGDLLVTRVYREVCKNFGVDQPIPIYTSSSAISLMHARTIEPCMIAPESLLSTRDERVLRYAIGVRLAMCRPPHMLAGCLPAAQLKLILACLIHEMRPDFPFADTVENRGLQRSLKRHMREEHRVNLTRAVQEVFDDESLAHVDAWLQDVAVESARVGLVMCDDPAAAERLCTEVSATLSTVGVEQIRNDLARYAWSGALVALRAELGVAVG